ncbi:MAG TPA: S24 family peptidase [Candidatus Acidoferrum sp.]|nr:S24 family peptidase [Candidatus Acidoferrum sp.]
MHPIQEKLLGLSRKQNLATVSLRELARLIAMPEEPAQKIKHHLLQLQKKGFLSIDRAKGVMNRAASTSTIAKDLTGKNSSLFSIPIIGTANCGPATIFAEENFQGFLRVSSKLVGRSKPAGLYAIKTDGSSMNRATINDRTIDDGDLVIVDGNSKVPRENDVVLAIIDGNATIKRFIDDRANGQIVLKADSSFDYDPIYLHPDDDFQISGKIIGVIKKPKT